MKLLLNICLISLMAINCLAQGTFQSPSQQPTFTGVGTGNNSSGGATNGIQQSNGFGTNTTLVNASIISGSVPFTTLTGGYTNTLFVATNGNDATAVRGGVIPFATPMAARTASIPGDLVIVYPGIYTNQVQLLTNGLNWYFYAGTTLSNFLDDSNSITTKPFFDDSFGVVTNRITGKVNLYANFGTNIQPATTGFGTNKHPTTIGSANFNYAMVSIQNSNSSLHADFGSLYIEDRTNLNGRIVINCSNCLDAKITFDEILEPKVIITYVTNLQTWSYGPAINGSVAIYWGLGEMTISGNHIDRGFQYASWCNEPNDGSRHTNNYYFTCPYIESKLYTSTPATNDDTANSSYRSWFNLNGGWLHTSNAVSGEICAFYGGYNYLNNFGKISDEVNGITAIAAVGSASVWVTMGDKITSNGGRWANTRSNNAVGVGLPSLHMVVLQYDAPSGGCSATGGFLFQGQQRVDIEGGDVVVTNGVPIFYNSAGIGNNQVYFKNMTIDNSAWAGATNYTVIVDTNGLYLQNCVIVAPTASESIFSTTAQNVGILGQTMANRNKDANITLTPLGTFTVDAAVK